MKNYKDHIMVTGSNGFIGSNLASYLSKKYFVHAFYRSKKKLKNSKKIFNKKTDLTKLKKINPKIKFLVHCASNTPPRYTQKNCYRNNTKIDTNLLNLIKKSNIKIFVFLSSISVYGKNRPRVISENTIVKPSDLYGKSKFETELKIKKLSKKLNIKFIILRLCTIIGPNCHSTFLSRIGDKIKHQNKLNVYGSNNYFNSCMHISTLSKNIFQIINLRKLKKNFNLITLHSKRPIKLKQIFKIFKNKLNKSVCFRELETKNKGYLIKSNQIKKYEITTDNTINAIKNYVLDLK